MKKYKIYLDDVRIPVNKEWTLVTDYYEFIEKINEIGLENIECISLDHDLGDSAMNQYYTNVANGKEIDYSKITEKTGMDCARWLTMQWMNGQPVCQIYTHSANPVGRENIIGLINSYYKTFNYDLKAQAIFIHHGYNDQVLIKWASNPDLF